MRRRRCSLFAIVIVRLETLFAFVASVGLRVAGSFNAMSGLKRTAEDTALGQPPSSKRAKNDDFLPVRLSGIQGEPTLVRIYTVSGDYVDEWSLPSTAKANSLCTHAAFLYLTNPGRFSFIGAARGPRVISFNSSKPLIWMFGFAKIISLQIVVREPTTFEMHFGEYGWRPLRNWRRLVEDKLGRLSTHLLLAAYGS